ncbi:MULTISPECIES: YihY/virulence factor BrkB family protein [unclassified Leptolyngbya]|uniref:YihY/virulence factor BrkB family protein n=1 Tax=unclassified Leptolyngbya TaxID=2650499 RepID=UPI001686DA11|nr:MULTISPECIES: YihY/virulence factor BrkB family protein [unclassified Leptolyngbya]MBD1910282.1 YihY/virulence factor BrkB family protein [Leptolyngbya sp. FACHB-8]MBD2155806.1 YihY/virulence factor BrkB family protein [Leptolyngbya sp. FACHB-16]
MRASALFPLLKATYAEWTEDKVPRLAAALAYFTIFSLAPLLVIAISIAALFFGEEAARGQIVGQIQGLLGQEGASFVEAMIVNANRVESGGFATVIGIITLLVGASGVFGQLQDALNTIWEVAPRPDRGIINFIRTRFLSFGMVVVIGFLLLVSLVISALVAGIGTYMNGLAPSLAPLWELVNFLVSFGIITFLFALIYKVLPDVHITWGDVGIGAAVTALLFTIGRTLIGIYLGSAAIGSAYGAAGSLVVILVWVFYSAQILLFGAEFTQVYARRYGSQIRPTSLAVPLTEQGRVQQGIPTKEYVEAIAQSKQPESSSTSAPTETTPIRRASTSSPSVVAVILGSALAIVEAAQKNQRRKKRNRY